MTQSEHFLPQLCTFELFKSRARAEPIIEESPMVRIWFKEIVEYEETVLSYVESPGEDALRDAHRATVHNSFWSNSAGNADISVFPRRQLPPKEVLDEYAYLRNVFPRETALTDIEFLVRYLAQQGYRAEMIPGAVPGESAAVIRLADNERVVDESAVPATIAAAAHLWSLLHDQRDGVITRGQFVAFDGEYFWGVLRGDQGNREPHPPVVISLRTAAKSLLDAFHGNVPERFAREYADLSCAVQAVTSLASVGDIKAVTELDVQPNGVSVQSIAPQQRAKRVLSRYSSGERVADLYDTDHIFAGALNDLVGPDFEYPNYSHLTVGEVLQGVAAASRRE